MILQFRKMRMGIVFALFCTLYIVILSKLFFLQVLYHSFFTDLGNRQYVTSITKTPDRALIFDRNGIPLALNHTYMSVFIIPRAVTNPDKLRSFLIQYFPQAVARYEADRHASFMYVQRRITQEQQNLIEQEDNPDIFLMPEAGRFYPLACAGTVVGITNIDNEGTSGLELACNEQLRGKPSIFSLKRDARNARHFYFERHLSEYGHNGTDLITTIDSTVQFIAHEELLKTIEEFSAREGSVVVMDPKTGEIYAMVNYPTFDPNDTKQLLIEHMKNRAVTETYEFGSVIKIFLALAALAEGVVTPETLINCYNTKSITLQGMRLTTVHPHGILSFSEVIQGSNNIGTAQIALLLNEAIYVHYRRCGFGTSTDTFLGEQAGYITHPSRWSQQSLASLSYGYEIRATLLQLARAVCMIANQGVPVKPCLILQKQMYEAASQSLYTQEVIETLSTMLEKTVSQGTAQRARIQGYRILGKTGTANLIVDGAYHPDHNIYTFVGIVSKGSYQRVIATFIKESRVKNIYASMVTAPLFERIAERILIHDGQIVST